MIEKKAEEKKPVKVKKAGRPKKSSYVKKVEGDVKKLYELVAGQTAVLQTIQETLTGEKPPVSKDEQEEIEKSVTKNETKTDYPVPEDYRKAVDLILNQDFGIIVEPCKDTPEFNLVIVVPNKYSNFTIKETRIKKVDLRSKLVSYAEKTNGVKAWAEKIFSSFNAEFKAQIVNDRKAT